MYLIKLEPHRSTAREDSCAYCFLASNHRIVADTGSALAFRSLKCAAAHAQKFNENAIKLRATPIACRDIPPWV